ncbi:MAG: glutathione S-transferase [Sneathiella sp.]|nr:glutathione S-transferase [Sneathiella sp.]
MAPLDTRITLQKHAVLYSFRRCPYAMRARVTLHSSGQPVELRDILLKDKPAQMLDASPKATVPVLILEDGTVLDESRDIMYWAVSEFDPQNWYPENPKLRTEINRLIDENDGPFKSALDRYKYHVRFPENSRQEYRRDGEKFLMALDTRLLKHDFLVLNTATLADVAIFPFVRQFANSDRAWFDQSPYTALQKWLDNWTTSDTFKHLMKKRNIWKPDTHGPLFPDLIEDEMT